jgi:hypothetical protein
MTDCALEARLSQPQPYLTVVPLCSYPDAPTLQLSMASTQSSQRGSGTDLTFPPVEVDAPIASQTLSPPPLSLSLSSYSQTFVSKECEYPKHPEQTG